MQVEDEFVEIQDKEKENKPEPKTTPNRPDFRIVQTEVDRDGKTIFKNVGGMWKNTSKNGNEFYTLMIGQLKLLVFPNQNK
ncbi:MAG: DUF736 family protein [Candidatus Micrarchaeota archaeon]